MRICERNNSADTKVSEEGGGGDAPGPTAEITLQTMEKTVLGQAVPLQPIEVHGGADLHLQTMEGTPCQRRWVPEGSCDTVKSLQWSRLLPGPADLWREEPALEQVWWQGF